MLHRESGVFKTSYAADMALYPLPIARWTVAAIIVLFAVVLPLSLDEYYLSIINLVLIAIVGALGLNILVGYTGQISVGHAAFMSVGAYTAANLAVHLQLPFWVTLPAGGLMAALVGAVVGIPSLQDQGPLSRHRHSREPADHRMDHQPHAGHLRRRAGIHRGGATRVHGARNQDPGGPLLLSAVLRGFRHACGAQHRQEPHRPRLRRHPRPGHCRRDHRHQHLRLQAAVVRHLLVLRGRVRRALHLLFRHRQLRGVPDRRIHRLSRHDHHRRARLRARHPFSALSS